MDIIIFEPNFINNRIGVHICNLPGIFFAVEDNHQAFNQINQIYEIGFQSRNTYKNLEEFKNSEQYRNLKNKKFEIYERISYKNSYSFKFIESN